MKTLKIKDNVTIPTKVILIPKSKALHGVVYKYKFRHHRHPSTISGILDIGLDKNGAWILHDINHTLGEPLYLNLSFSIDKFGQIEYVSGLDTFGTLTLREFRI